MNSLPPASSDPTRMVISAALCQEMLAHILSCLPEEACGIVGGILAGESAVAQLVLPVENELHSPVRFRMSPAEQLKAFLLLEDRDQELVAIFHSHPKGPDHPSATDLAEFAYPGVITIIISPQNAHTLPEAPFAGYQIRAYRLDGVLSGRAAASEVPLVITGEAADSRNLPLP